jgi:hypothetical protein
MHGSCYNAIPIFPCDKKIPISVYINNIKKQPAYNGIAKPTLTIHLDHKCKIAENEQVNNLLPRYWQY